jgi:predicted nucleic acid-binding protein
MTAKFVVDTSIAMSWFFEDETTIATQRLLEDLSSKTALVPAWWFLEIANVFAVGERRRRVSAAQIDDFVKVIEGIRIEVDDEASNRAFSHILPLCRTHALASYDAIYLDLAVRRRLPLATLDEPLRKAAKKLGVKLLGK